MFQGFQGPLITSPALFLPSPPCSEQTEVPVPLRGLNQVQVKMVTSGITGFACNRYQAV
jgi:hypothetical protein